jgi:hypothetical protein
MNKKKEKKRKWKDSMGSKQWKLNRIWKEEQLVIFSGTVGRSVRMERKFC